MEEERDAARRAEFMQALTTEHAMLQSGRSLSGTEIAFRATLYVTTVSSAVVALALVANVSGVGEAFLIFALAILPVIYFLGVVTYGRMLQNAVEFIMYGQAISRIRRFYAEIDPTRAEFFPETLHNELGLQALGLFNLRWQQYLAATTTVAIVNAVVGGAFVALVVAELVKLPAWAPTVVGGLVSAVLAATFLRHQRRTWSRVAAGVRRQPGESTNEPGR